MDSFGRTRRCQKKDLPELQKRDADVSSVRSYQGFVAASVDSPETQPETVPGDEERLRMRQAWEAEEEQNRNKSKLHYQDVLHQGINLTKNLLRQSPPLKPK